MRCTTSRSKRSSWRSVRRHHAGHSRTNAGRAQGSHRRFHAARAVPRRAPCVQSSAGIFREQLASPSGPSPAMARTRTTAPQQMSTPPHTPRQAHKPVTRPHGHITGERKRQEESQDGRDPQPDPQDGRRRPRATNAGEMVDDRRMRNSKRPSINAGICCASGGLTESSESTPTIRKLATSRPSNTTSSDGLPPALKRRSGLSCWRRRSRV